MIHQAIDRISVARVCPNSRQPREVFCPAGIRALAATIEEHGLLQPILVRHHLGRRVYELIAGERRWRAVKHLGWTHISAIVIEATDDQSAEMALVENIMREDLNPIEQARVFQQLLNNGSSYRSLARRIGKDKGYVQNRVRLLTMPADVQELVANRPHLITHAYELAKIRDQKLRRYYLAKLSGGGNRHIALTQLRHELRYAQVKARDSVDPLYALWDYDYLRDPKDGDEFYQGNCTASVVRRCLECISRNTPFRRGFTLWIPFAGSGTGVRTAGEMGIGRIIASDVVPMKRGIQRRDARHSGLPPNSVDAIFAHPPYWDAVRYSKVYRDSREPADMSQLRTLPEFLKAIEEFYIEAARVLKPGGHLFVMIGDVRKANKLVPLTAHLALLGERFFDLTQRVTKIRKRSSRLMPVLVSNAKKRGHLVDITDTILFFRKPLKSS